MNRPLIGGGLPGSGGPSQSSPPSGLSLQPQRATSSFSALAKRLLLFPERAPHSHCSTSDQALPSLDALSLLSATLPALQGLANISPLPGSLSDCLDSWDHSWQELPTWPCSSLFWV